MYRTTYVRDLLMSSKHARTAGWQGKCAHSFEDVYSWEREAGWHFILFSSSQCTPTERLPWPNGLTTLRAIRIFSVAPKFQKCMYKSFCIAQWDLMKDDLRLLHSGCDFPVWLEQKCEKVKFQKWWDPF